MSGPLVQAIGWALLHLLWQGALVAAILAAALALLRRQSANARYLASCGALLLLVVLGIGTAYRLYQPLPADSPSIVTIPAAPSLDGAAVTDTAISAVSFLNIHLAQIVAIWLIGVLILSARLVAGWIGARRLAAKGAHAAGEQWQRSLYRIASTLRLWRAVRLLESAAVEVPTVIGWLRPVILLPVASLSGLSTQQIEMVLAHELAHIRRHDFIVNLMQSVVETLLFYHPAVWWISKRIRIEREHCCDDLAVAVFGDPLQYARALTRFEELRLNSAQTILAANGGSLLARIRRLVLARAESASWSSRWAAGAALLTVLAAVLFGPTLPLFANREPPAAQSAPAPHPTPAPKVTVTPAPAPSPKKAATCDGVTPQTDAEIDVEAPDPDVDMDIDNSTVPMAEVAPMARAAAVAVRPMIAPLLRNSAALAQAVAGGVRGGVLGGIEDGVKWGVDGAPRMKVRRHIGQGGKLTVDDLIELRTAGVDSKYIEEMRGAGIGELSLDDLVNLRMQGVTPRSIRELSDAGYSHITAQQLMQLRGAGVTPAFIKSLADAGYAKLSVEELIRLRMSGVNADFIRELSKYRSK